ncbi:hypothetical protein ABG067_003987 [Albugo candida]
MDSWDDDEYEVPAVLSEAPKVSWEDEEEPESKEEVKQDVEKSLPTKPKQAKKNKLKELREKQKQDIEQTKMLLQAQTLATPEEQKAHVQKLVENADFDSAADIFGADFIRKDRDLEQVTRDEKSSNKTEKTDIEATISKMRLATEADAERLGNVVASKLIASPNTKSALSCLKLIITRGSTNLTAEDMKELTTIINVIKNDKIAATKPKGKKKKQTGKQGYTKVEYGKDADGLNDYIDNYDEFDQFDEFM